MSKRKPMDKVQARERRNRLLESAAAAELSLVDGVREMRAISGMTQEEFARHRQVSARVIKAIELGQGNPTVATLNRIGEFFGLEVAFVPIQRTVPTTSEPQPGAVAAESAAPAFMKEGLREALKREVHEILSTPDFRFILAEQLQAALGTPGKPAEAPAPEQVRAAPDIPVQKKKKP